MPTTLAPSPGTPVPNLNPGAISGLQTTMLQPPQNLTTLQATSPPVVGLPGTAWTTGVKVTLGNGTDAHWTGTAWAAGPA